MSGGMKVGVSEDDLIVHEPTPQEINKFKRACKALNDLGRAGFTLYLANDTMNLMIGPSHDSKGVSRPDRVRENVSICRSGGGDW